MDKIVQLKIKSLFLVLVLCSAHLSYGCEKDNDVSEEPIDAPEETSPIQWRVTEIDFISDKLYSNGFDDVDLDVVFMHSDGTEINVPAFWNGRNNWIVRFSPTFVGLWEYCTICSDVSNTGLHNKTGSIICTKYHYFSKIPLDFTNLLSNIANLTLSSLALRTI